MCDAKRPATFQDVSSKVSSKTHEDGEGLMTCLHLRQHRHAVVERCIATKTHLLLCWVHAVPILPWL